MEVIQLKNIAVIGSGTMGQGIAQWFCQQGTKVLLIDRDLETAQKAVDKIYKSWDDLVLKNKFTSEQNALFKKNLSINLLSNIEIKTDLVIEAVYEDLTLKIDLFKKLDALVHSETIIATNTSSFLIRDLKEAVSKKRRERFLGLHFFNPATLMKLVEVAKGEETSQKICEDLAQWFNHKGKTAVHCQDSPGLIVNRLARHFYGEAFRAFEQEKLDFKAIDQVMREVGGFKMGPFELMDLIGIDINLDVTKSVWQSFDKAPRFKAHSLQELKVKEGHLGKKVKKGFYEYP